MATYKLTLQEASKWKLKAEDPNLSKSQHILLKYQILQHILKMS
jgi:hypothetical protein